MLRAHSAAKHRALDGYLRRYVAAYTQNRRVQHLSLTVVEGFAGGNLYIDESTGNLRHGSPGVILHALRDAAAQVQAKRKKPFYFADRYFFIEKDRHAFDVLKESLSKSEHSSLLGNAITLINDEFARSLPAVFDEIRKAPGRGRALFILDQCGYTDVPCDLIALILRTFRNAEVILTFAFDYLANYLSSETDTKTRQEKTGIDFEALKCVDKTDQRWRFVMQKILSDDLTAKTNARFYTPFFIRSVDANRDLWLVHLSQHVKARDEMGELHWDLQTAAAHYGRAGTNMLGFDPRNVNGDQIPRLPGFGFDELALRNSIDALCEELPRRLRDEFGDTSFIDLFSALANETPATRRIFKYALHELHGSNEVVIRDKTGLTYRKGKSKMTRTSSSFLPTRRCSCRSGSNYEIPRSVSEFPRQRMDGRSVRTRSIRAQSCPAYFQGTDTLGRRQVIDDRRKTYRSWDAGHSCQGPVSGRGALPQDNAVFSLLDLASVSLGHCR
jgi:three-Cys-motif partner protein